MTLSSGGISALIVTKFTGLKYQKTVQRLPHTERTDRQFSTVSSLFYHAPEIGVGTPNAAI